MGQSTWLVPLRSNISANVRHGEGVQQEIQNFFVGVPRTCVLVRPDADLSLRLVKLRHAHFFEFSVRLFLFGLLHVRTFRTTRSEVSYARGPGQFILAVPFSFSQPRAVSLQFHSHFLSFLNHGQFHSSTCTTRAAGHRATDRQLKQSGSRNFYCTHEYCRVLVLDRRCAPSIHANSLHPSFASKTRELPGPPHPRPQPSPNHPT